MLGFELSTEDTVPFETVEVEPDPAGLPCPEHLRDRVTIDVIHDGCHVPGRFYEDSLKNGTSAEEIEKQYILERDWGAELVAQHLASALHLPSYHRINIARVLLDFGRFPGSTPPGADFLNRLAINLPFSEHLSYEHKREVLERYYDPISEDMERAISGKLIKIAIHTYDVRNPTRTQRPPVSIITRSRALQEDFQLPVGLFDPLYPDELAQYTADRILRSRIALTLEEAGVHVEDNFPYPLPEGSVEVRSQIWFFFRHLRAVYEAAHPRQPHEDEEHPRDAVFQMLLDTNLRSSRSEALRSYLHSYRRTSHLMGVDFLAARREYEQLAAFMEREGDRLIRGFRTSPERTSSLAIEVRKDLVVDFDAGRPVRLRPEDARFIAVTLASGIRTYLTYDRDLRQGAAKLGDPRYE